MEESSTDPSRSPWASGRWHWPRLGRGSLALAVLLQVALAAVPLHRSYDRTAFEAAGYLVATGQSPYLLHDLAAVFHSAEFRVFDTIGYPPPWPLLLGGIYRVTYALVPDLHLYAFAMKLPVIAAAIGLACLAAAAAHNLGASPRAVRGVRLALLFNPLLVYVAAVRGQIDPIVALLALAALLLLVSGRRDSSAVTLALAVCFKPIAAPLLPAVLLSIAATSARRALRFSAVFIAGVLGFYVLPFVVLGWDASPFGAANSQLALSGAMSPATVAGLWTGQAALAGHWWMLGLVWLPALVVAVVLAGRGGRDVAGLLALGLGFTLVFFLTRPWLSETNAVLLLAPGLVLVTLGRLRRVLYTAFWVLPLLMTLTYLWPVKLLWAVAPGAAAEAAFWAEGPGVRLLLLARVVVIVAWQAAGWLAVVACLRRSPGAQAVAREASLSPGAPPAASGQGAVS